MEEEAPPPGLSRCTWILVGALGFAVVAVVIMSFIMIAWGARNDASQAQRQLINCSGTNCTSYESFLWTTLNISVDPCEDFKAFVTSRWLPNLTTAPYTA